MAFIDDLSDGLNDIFGEGAQTITYNGVPIQAIVRLGRERGQMTNTQGLADEAVIVVRKTDISTMSKGTPVLFNDESWQVLARVRDTRLTHEIALFAKASPLPRRSLP